MMDRKRLSRITAAILTLAVAASGCSNVSKEPQLVGGGESASEVSEVTETASETGTSLSAETSVSSETETSPESSDTETGESSETESDTETGTETSETEEESETSFSRSWFETNSSGTMYITADCVGREAADNNSTIITKYQKGDAVEIAALTDSGFYKIKGGGYIHSEYLTDNPVTETSSETAAETSEKTTPKETQETTSKTTSKKTETSADDTSEIFIDDDDNNNNNDSANTDDIAAASVKFTDRYAYKQLNKTEQQFYADIVAAAESLNTAVKIPEGMSKNDAHKLYMIVYIEEPQLFWLGGSVSVSGDTMLLNYMTDKAGIKKMQEEIDANAAPVLAKINRASSTYEKLKVIYDFVVLNNNFSLNSKGYNGTIYNAFVKDGDLQCAGYAKTVQYFCDLSGIDSTVVVGTNANGESHAWNVLYCGDGYYNFDTTWGDPINDYDGRYIRHTYFLVPDSEIHEISHCNVNSFFLSDGTKIKCFDPPKCTKTTYNYFKQEGLYFKDYDSADAALREAIKKAVANKENVVQIRVSDEELFNKLTSGSAPAAYQKYAKSLSPSVKSIGKYSGQTYKATGVVTVEINYN